MNKPLIVLIFLVFSNLSFGADNHNNFSTILENAENNDAKAQYTLAKMYEKGEFVNKSYRQAVYWYSKAAQQGYSKAQYKLGKFYQSGKYVKQDYKKALKLYRKAAFKIHKAQYRIGLHYLNGWGVEQNDQTALVWFYKAAEHNNRDAQYQLAKMFRNGRSVSKNDYTAHYWFKKAAGQNHKKAKRKLAKIQIQDSLNTQIENEPRSEQKYLSKIREMADLGNKDAQYQLGVIYANGEEQIPQILSLAYKWLELAIRGGHEKAANDIITVLNNMSNKELVQGYRYVKKYQPEFRPISFTVFKAQEPISNLNSPPELIRKQQFKIGRLSFPEGESLYHKDIGYLNYTKNFILQIKTKLNVRQAGNYIFNISSDDGFKLQLNDTLICKYIKTRKMSTSSCNTYLNKGEHLFELSYFQGSGNMGLKVSYEYEDKSSVAFGKNSDYIIFKPLSNL